MASEINIQELVHRLEEGGWVRWVRIAALVLVVGYVTAAWAIYDNGFKGLAHPRAMEQAGIARELVRGNGFSTKIVRPAEYWIYKKNKGGLPEKNVPDTYHAPLWPAVLAPVVGLMKSKWEMDYQHQQLYPPDLAIAGVGLLFFLLSVMVQYFVAARLFDKRMAAFAVALMLICDQFWRFSMSGLPQMLMLFLFSCATYALVRLVEQQEEAVAATIVAPEELPLASDLPTVPREGEPLPPPPLSIGATEAPPLVFSFPWWALVAGLSLGLLALTHSITLFIAAGAIIFCVSYFRGRRLLVGGLVAAMVVLCYAPWLVRNYQVCGNALGVGWYSGLYQVRGTESSVMRSKEPPLAGVSPATFRNKMQAQLLWQMGNLPQQLGYSMLAPVFLIALLHPFKRRHTGNFRWCALLMYAAAILGMIVLGLDDEPLKANDLHVLFIPLLSFYGMAYLLVLWSRLEINVRLLRYGFIGLLFLLSGIPFLLTVIALHLPSGMRVQWPPYVQPYIAILGTWTNEKEIIMSDMPWAVSWYADRRSLWLPAEMRDFLELHDYGRLNGKIVGLYLTPVSRNRSFLYDIFKGEYRAWAPFIENDPQVRSFQTFPFREATLLPMDGDCIFFSDRNRWRKPED